MKKLTKLAAVALTGAALFIGTNVKAQTTTTTPTTGPWRFGIGLEAGVPTGNAHNGSNFDLGGTARLQYDASDSFDWTLTSGYYNFFAKNNGTDQGVVPLKLGIKTFFSQNVYFGAEAGAGFETNGYKDTKLILSPGLGWANQSWDVGVRYENFSGQSNSYGFVGLRIAYGFVL